jgi:hypothetical protein
MGVHTGAQVDPNTVLILARDARQTRWRVGWLGR